MHACGPHVQHCSIPPQAPQAPLGLACAHKQTHTCTGGECAAVWRTLPLRLVVVILQQRPEKWKALLRQSYREHISPRKSLFCQQRAGEGESSAAEEEQRTTATALILQGLNLEEGTSIRYNRTWFQKNKVWLVGQQETRIS